MTRKYFGTDGMRGKTNEAPIDAMTILKLGMAAGLQFTKGEHRHQVVIGKDTRLSGYMIEAALESGFTSVGMDVVLVGPMPTPAIGMLTKSMRADLGVMISASHNPYYDNGIKLFRPDGFKLSDETQQKIEKAMGTDLSKKLAEPDKLGRAKRLDDAPGRYIEFVKNSFPRGLTLDGLKIVIDCANGAAYHLGPKILWELGAQVIPLGINPNGFNINDNCGSIHPDNMCREVVKHKADIGIALDGDGDRITICDEKGKIINGDQIMTAIAVYMKSTNKLAENTVIATQMSNMGMEIFLQKQGIEVRRTKVGDRYVIAEMLKTGANLGGEQSGHIILSDYSTTGDGLIAALQALAIMTQQKLKASQCLNRFKPLPQILKNIGYNAKSADPLKKQKVKQAISEAEKALGKQGRIFIRKSGTEPVIRVMAEGKDKKLVETLVNRICKEISGL